MKHGVHKTRLYHVEMAKLKHPDTFTRPTSVTLRACHARVVMRGWSVCGVGVGHPLILPPFVSAPPAPDFLGNDARPSLSLPRKNRLGRRV